VICSTFQTKKFQKTETKTSGADSKSYTPGFRAVFIFFSMEGLLRGGRKRTWNLAHSRSGITYRVVVY